MVLDSFLSRKVVMQKKGKLIACDCYVLVFSSPVSELPSHYLSYVVS